MRCRTIMPTTPRTRMRCQIHLDRAAGGLRHDVQAAYSHSRTADLPGFEELQAHHLHNEDHDVFGDGTVIIKTAPGHTPGHQMLLLKLAKFGPCCSPAICTICRKKDLDRVPTFDFDAATTRASANESMRFCPRHMPRCGYSTIQRPTRRSRRRPTTTSSRDENARLELEVWATAPQSRLSELP